VEAALYRQTEKGPVRLSPGGRVSPGDQVFAQITTSIDTHVFVINEDDKGAAFQLYPLRSEGTGRPLPAGRLTRLPGVKDGRQMNWVVSASGGRDHFVFFVTPDPQYARELGRLFADLPEPSADMPVISRTISPETINQLRSFGGLAPAAPASTRPGQRLVDQYRTPLPAGAEVTRGHWIRTATLRSPEPGQP
jgi:hypothetical protein